MFPKKKRIKDEKLLAELREKPCEVCGAMPVDVHHLKSVGSGGGDEIWNLVSACRKCHSEFHQYGLNEFAKRNPNVISILTKRGWRYDDNSGKWRRDLH